MTLPSWILKIISVWTGLGTLLVIFGANGVLIPTWLTPYFSDTFIQATEIVLGAVIAFLNVIKTIKNSGTGDAEVKAMSTGRKLGYALNPFAV